MKNDLFSIGPFTIHGYGLMIALGIVVCVIMGTYRAKKHGYKEDAVLDIAIFSVLAGFLGAKLLFVLVEFDRFLENPMQVLGSEGFVVYGGIIAGVPAAVLYCRIKKLSFWNTLTYWLPLFPLRRVLDESGVFWQVVVTDGKPMHSGASPFRKEDFARQEFL